MASPAPMTRLEVARKAGLASRRKQARGAARQWVGKETERDRLLVARVENGERVADLATEYGISRARAYQILDDYEVPRRAYRKSAA